MRIEIYDPESDDKPEVRLGLRLVEKEDIIALDLYDVWTGKPLPSSHLMTFYVKEGKLTFMRIKGPDINHVDVDVDFKIKES